MRDHFDPPWFGIEIRPSLAILVDIIAWRNGNASVAGSHLPPLTKK
jgi:hypothetical protein